MNKSTIRLFRAVPITVKKGKKPSKELLKKTLKRGFVFSPEVVHNYPNCDNIIKLVEKEVGLTPEKLTNSFHKSWEKVKTASMEQLIIEQLVHYFTTYGYDALGIEGDVFIPHEKLEIPVIKEGGVNITVIRGYTKKELKEKLMKLLSSGIALNEETIKDVLDVIEFVGLNQKDVELIKNKEVKIILYDNLKIVPKNPTEFLRYIIFKATNKTLIIKNAATIEGIKENKISDSNLKVIDIFARYQKEYGLRKLSEIFYRFKPIWLAFKDFKELKPIINKIRRMARTYHKPMPEDYLNTITAKIKNKEKIDTDKLTKELNRVNIFRKIRLAYALKFRTTDSESIMYKIRSGKGYATNFNFEQKNAAKRILDVVLDSITKDIGKNVKGKKIYIPENVTYTLPATEKQFTGNFPSGSYISMPKDMIVGIHWENVDEHRIDLDLSLIGVTTGKIGWDADYRTENRSILFSGDMTDAEKPKGATELIYVKKQKTDAFILLVNYFNYDSSVEVPFKIILAKEEISDFKEDYMVNPNNVVSIAKSNINQRQKILGLLVTTTNECRFYFSETYLGLSISSSNSEFVKNSRQYLFDFYKNAISLNDVLVKAGAKIVKKKDKGVIDLSPENLEKDTILNLIS